MLHHRQLSLAQRAFRAIEAPARRLERRFGEPFCRDDLGQLLGAALARRHRALGVLDLVPQRFGAPAPLLQGPALHPYRLHPPPLPPPPLPAPPLLAPPPPPPPPPP